MTGRTVALLLASGVTSEHTATALKLAERLLARGHRVAVFAHGDAAGLAAGTGELPTAVTALLRRGVHEGTFDWVVDQASVERLGVAPQLTPGAVPGDHADLWAVVRHADLVLTAGGGSPW